MGIMNSHIYFDAKDSSWRIQSYRDEEKYLVSDRNTIVPLGHQSWANGNPFCTERGNHFPLTLTTCYPGKFSCKDGSCVPIKYVQRYPLTE